MEHRAPYVLIGAFVLAVIFASFAFVYWMGAPGGIGQQAQYTVRFENTVSGLSKGAAVQFNGVRVGEVTELRFADGGRVEATVTVVGGTPIRSDTRVGMDFQGVTGIPVVTFEGGTGNPLPPGPGGGPPVLAADPTAGQSMTLMARTALRSFNTILEENAEPLKSAIANINTFTAALARNSDKVDGILEGIERMTGGGKGNATGVIYDLTPPKDFPAIDKPLPGPMTVPELSTVLLYDTQKVLVRPGGGNDPSFESARWADSLPKLLQARIVQSFENAKFLGRVTKPLDGLQPKFQLMIDLRRFQISTTDNTPVADIEFTAKITGDDGNVVAAELFHVTAPAQVTDAGAAAKALNAAFGKAATDLVVWASGAL